MAEEKHDLLPQNKQISSYIDNFNSILSKREEVINTNMLVLKNSNPKDLKVFPEEIKKAALDHYFENLKIAVRDNEFVPFIPDKKANGTLQVINPDKLPLWQKMLEAWHNVPDTNADEILVSEYDCNGNTILMDIKFRDNTHAYFLTQYRKVSSWYSNNMRFIKSENGKFHEETGRIMALTPYVDAVIYGHNCYIINESHFETIFKFDDVVKTQIKENETEIRSLAFIDNADVFMETINKYKRQRSAMAKVIMQKRLAKIKSYSPKYIREQIEGQPELSYIKYTSDDKIIMDEKSSKTVVGILCGTINLDLITKELNGLDEDQ